MSRLGVIAGLEGKYPEAEALLSQSLAIQRRVLGPEHADTLWSMATLADVYRDEGKYAQAEALYRKSLEGSPDDPKGARLNGLAWHLVSVPDPGQRRPREALDLARRAVKAAPDSGNYYNTLGLAEYRNGLWDEAIVSLNKSAELNKGAEPTDFFFLSMAHWKRGDKDEAERFFERGVDGASKGAANRELRMFWGEAAQLLNKPGLKARASQSPR